MQCDYRDAQCLLQGVFLMGIAQMHDEIVYEAAGITEYGETGALLLLIYRSLLKTYGAGGIITEWDSEFYKIPEIGSLVLVDFAIRSISNLGFAIVTIQASLQDGTALMKVRYITQLKK